MVSLPFLLNDLVSAALPYVHVPEFKIGPIPIRPFGLLVVTGILIGANIGTRRARRLGLDEERFSSHVFATIASGILISHVLDTIFYYPETLLTEPWRIFFFWQGLSSFGGFIGAFIGFTIYGRRHRLPLWPTADCIAFGLPFGWFFGRMGCSVVHDHPGVMSDHFLAVAYPEGPRFDLGLMELMLTPLLILAVLIVNKMSKRPGAIAVTLLLVYPWLRFPLDFLRAPAVDGGDIRYFAFTPGQYLCVIFFIFGIYLWRRSRKQAEATAVESTQLRDRRRPAH